MFKSMKLKKMAKITSEFVERRNWLFEKYNASVSINMKPNHRMVENKNGIEVIIPFSLNCTFNDKYGIRIIKHINDVHICMNSIYLIAKTRNERPEDTLEFVLTNLSKSLFDGIYHQPLTVSSEGGAA